MNQTCDAASLQAGSSSMSVFERYLSLWVFLCNVAGIALGHLLPSLFRPVGAMEVAQVTLPVGLQLWVCLLYTSVSKSDIIEI